MQIRWTAYKWLSNFLNLEKNNSISDVMGSWQYNFHSFNKAYLLYWQLVAFLWLLNLEKLFHFIIWKQSHRLASSYGSEFV